MEFKEIKEQNKNKNIMPLKIRSHSKASEHYIDVRFSYPNTKEVWEGSIPFEYRRLGLDLKSPDEVVNLLQDAYKNLSRKNRNDWANQQLSKWNNDHSKKGVTKEFFDKLCNLQWNCVKCELPKNPNWARRIQDIKEMGYLLSTDTARYCNQCKQNNTHILLVPFEIGPETGYEVISPELKKKIIKLLKGKNVYEDRVRNANSLIPDHKFPEIRWDKDTKAENPDHMTDQEIRKKFQLLDNQRNQQKREVCRTCWQTGRRGLVFGISFYYQGDENWPENIPSNGKDAENGCVGCGWYDLEEWRNHLNQTLRDLP